MSHAGGEDGGTGLGDAFDILLKAPPERLFSVVLQLRDSAEDVMVQALCLIVLQRREQALEKLQTLGGNPLAKHLAESGRASSKLDDFGAHCGRFREQSGECLSSLARIFKVLSEQRLCEVSLRNLAYRRALSSDSFKTSSGGSLEYRRFVEEAKAVCGPQCAARTCSSADLKSGCSSEPNASLNEESATFQELQDESSSALSPLQESPSEASYPSHLEISLPPTVSFQGVERAPEASGSSTPSPSVLLTEHEAKSEQSPLPEPEYKSNESSLFRADKDSKTDGTLKSVNESPNQPSTATSTLPSPLNISLPKIPVLKIPHGPEEEEEIFYAFVILHAPEDEELAERMKEKLEAVVGSEGATFSDGFAIPGKSTLKCVEDAVENSAYTFLLLTTNFNTKMLEVKTNMALINSIKNEHKFNTVIPLLPEDNCMQRIPLVLQTLVPLVEKKKGFQRKLQKALSPTSIQTQRRIWAKEQAVKRLSRLSWEAANLSLYTEQHHLGSRMALEHGGGNNGLQWPPPPNIHIENAKYILIGNDSTMTVDLGENANNDGSI